MYPHRVYWFDPTRPPAREDEQAAAVLYLFMGAVAAGLAAAAVGIQSLCRG